MLLKWITHLHIGSWFRMSFGVGFASIEPKLTLIRLNSLISIIQFSQYKQIFLLEACVVVNGSKHLQRRSDKQHDKPNRTDKQPCEDQEEHHRSVQLPICDFKDV